MGRTIIQISYNVGANAFMCLLAVKRGSTDCTDGLETMDALVVKAGLDPESVFLIDGECDTDLLARHLSAPPPSMWEAGARRVRALATMRPF